MLWKALAALGAAACGTLWHYSSQQGRELAELQAQIAEAKRLAQSSARAQAPERASLPAAAALSPAVPPVKAPSAERAVPRDNATRSHRRLVDWAASAEQAFATEGVDVGWARSAERGIEHAVVAILPPASRLRTVSCRETLCRVETEHSNASAADQFKAEAILGPSPVWRGALYAVQADAADAGSVISLYLVREGMTR